jgi:peptidoglycan/xylan/chitin deacetylase (PgdA/CDA1 family)
VSVCGLWRVKRATRGLQRRSAARGVVLMYHRVADLPSDPWALSVSPHHFAEQMETLRSAFCPLPLRELVRRLDGRELPARAVTVTFDDGYADNLFNATPILERHEVPATVFLSAGYIGSMGEFWWDELDRLLLQPGTLPGVLQLQIEGCEYEWLLGEDAEYSAEQANRDRAWTAWGQPDPTTRHTLYRTVWELMQPLDGDQRAMLLDDLRSWAAASIDGRPSHVILSWDEARRLACNGLIEIGGHTQTHALLRALPAPAQLEEIRGGRETLEAQLERLVDSFAYPFGREVDYTAETVALVRESGFTRACSNFPGLVQADTDRFQMPRLHVRDWDGDAFARQLAALLDG